MPLAVTVNDLGAVAAVDLDGVGAVAAFVQVGAFAGVPDHAVVAGLAEDLVVAGAAGQRVVAVAAEEQVVAALAEQGVVAGLAEELVVAGAAGEHVVAVAAEQVGRRQGAVGLVQRDACRCRPGRTPGSGSCWRPSRCRPSIDTAPPLTSSFPAASRLSVMRSLALPPITDSRPAPGVKLAVIAMVFPFGRGSAAQGCVGTVATPLGPHPKANLKATCRSH